MNQTAVRGYDVIGDVHGHGDALRRLLEKLGYERSDGVYGHPERQAVFVGDLIDRGPDQIGVVHLVRAMVEAGAAKIVLGNHEFNAIAYATHDPDKPGEYLRVRDGKHRAQHAEFLAQVGEDSALHREVIEWFRTIPLWCELTLGRSQLRVVHACWHEPSMEKLRPVLNGELSLTLDAVVEGSRKASPIYDAIEIVLKGPERDMGGPVYLDEGGHERSKARLRWWDPAGRSLRDLALIPSNARNEDGSPFVPLPDTDIDTTGLIYADNVPVVFGHYWWTGQPVVHSQTTATVDFSVAANGHLVAYQWNGERGLSSDRFVAVDWQ